MGYCDQASVRFVPVGSGDPIAAVNWPEMTMRFTITPQTKMSEIKTGDKVAFNFVQQGNLSLLQDIKVSQ